MVSIIVATDECGAIGKDNNLLWHLPNDMKHFRELTTGHTVIMGRKTFESLPKGALPNRKNIVLTSSDKQYENCLVYHSLSSALKACEGEDEIFIIGGGHVYREALDMADKLYVTFVHHRFPDADTFFPSLDPEKWEKTARTDFPQDEKNLYAHSFLTYVRKK